MVVSDCLIKNGYVDIESLKLRRDYPDEKRLAKGPVAIIECIQEIPCDPCKKSCPQGAIVLEGLTDIPELLVDKCIGCGICIAQCPGQAIFVIDMTFEEERGTVTFPYEFLPVPQKGELVQAVDRSGKYVCAGEVLKVIDAVKLNKTKLITIAVPKKEVQNVRFIKCLKEGEPFEK